MSNGLGIHDWVVTEIILGDIRHRLVFGFSVISFLLS